MKRIIGVALCTLLLGAAGAAARTDFDSFLSYSGFAYYGDDHVIHYGFVSSNKQKCHKQRRLRLMTDNGSGYKVTDTTTSSDKGAWALAAESDSTPFKIKLLPKTIGQDGCTGDKYPS